MRSSINAVVQEKNVHTRFVGGNESAQHRSQLQGFSQLFGKIAPPDADLESGSPPTAGSAEQDHSHLPFESAQPIKQDASTEKGREGLTAPVEDTFIAMIKEAGIPDLISPGNGTSNKIIKLGTLQQMNLYMIRRQLVLEVGKIQKGSHIASENSLMTVKNLMRDHASALRDWELILKYHAQAKGDDKNDMFSLTSVRTLDLAMMQDATLEGVMDKKFMDCLDSNDPILLGGHLIRIRERDDFLERFKFATFGDIALIGPILVMILHPGTTTSLVTVSVSVLLFAIIISKYSTGTPEGGLSIVAAYAAVLVVFVGTSN